MNRIKEILLNDWSLFRGLRVIAGLGLLMSAVYHHQTLPGFFGLFFLYQGLFNIRSCGFGACANDGCNRPFTPVQKANENQDQFP